MNHSTNPTIASGTSQSGSPSARRHNPAAASNVHTMIQCISGRYAVAMTLATDAFGLSPAEVAALKRGN